MAIKALTVASVPGAVAADGDALSIDFEFRGVVRNPNERLKAVIDGRRKFMFWCESVTDRDDGTVGLVRNRSANRIMGVETSRDVTTPVIIDEDRRNRMSRPINANRDRPS